MITQFVRRYFNAYSSTAPQHPECKGPLRGTEACSAGHKAELFMSARRTTAIWPRRATTNCLPSLSDPGHLSRSGTSNDSGSLGKGARNALSVIPIYFLAPSFAVILYSLGLGVNKCQISGSSTLQSAPHTPISALGFAWPLGDHKRRIRPPAFGRLTTRVFIFCVPL